jgi:uncharacterized membrane protein YgcG
MTTNLRAVTAGALTTLALAGVGCQTSGRDRATLGERYENYVDPCWPQRYSAVARDEALAPFATQAANGEIIAQTVWNYHFEAGTDRLTPSGIETLDMIVRKRPSPDAAVYVQTARDLAYEHDKADKLAADRVALDAKRINQVQKYLAAQAAAKGTTFNVVALDPADPAFYARYPGNAISQLPGRFTPFLNTGGSGGGASGGGAGGGASSGGTGR